MIFQLAERGLLKKQNSGADDDLMCLHVHYSKSNGFLNMLCSAGKKQVFQCSLDCQLEHNTKIMEYLTFVKWNHQNHTVLELKEKKNYNAILDFFI